MFSFSKSLITALCLLASCAAWAQTSAGAMSNDDVIKLVKAGLSEAIVLQTVDAAAAGCDPTAGMAANAKTAAAGPQWSAGSAK